MIIEKMPIDRLNPAVYNPRKNLRTGDPEYEKLKRSIEEFGLVEPIVWNRTTGNVVGGHQRLKVLKDMGQTEVDVVVVEYNEAKEKLANVALNKISGSWEFPKLADMLADLDSGEFDITITGFDEKELEQIANYLPENKGQTDGDAVPDAPSETTAKLGDIYILGKHRLMCGDSIKPEDVAKLMGEDRADMIFTDPPYAVNYGADQDALNMKSGGKFRHIVRPIIGDNLTAEETAEKLWRPVFRNLYEMAKDDCSFYMTMCQSGDQMMMMMMMMMSEHWQIKHELIWVKSSPVFSMGRLDYDYQHEPILYGWKEKHNFYGNGQFLKSIWEIPKPSKSDLHPTMKPIALIENALLNSSLRENIVLDLFGGSGSTMIACEKLGRCCRMMEIDPAYCDVIVKRWEEFTGGKAILRTY